MKTFAARRISLFIIFLLFAVVVRQEWGGQKVTIMLEDDAYLTKDGMKWFRPRQTAFYLIR